MGKTGKQMDKRRKLSYKVTVFTSVFALILIIILLFGSYTFYDYQQECSENAAKEARGAADRITSQIDERLSNLKQYYVTMAGDESVQWMLENEVTYSDYSHYKNAYDEMGGGSIFGEYIKSFTFVNFKTGWVLSNKGMFPFYQTYNGDMLTAIYEQKLERDSEKTYWSYDDGIEITTTVDKRYRVIAETDGLNLVMRLPASSYTTYALFIANVNLDTWKSWMQEGLPPYENLVVLDAASGQQIHGAVPDFYEACEDMRIRGMTQEEFVKDGRRYMIASAQSGILNWQYYVIYDIGEGQASIRLSGIFILLVALLILCMYVTVSYFLYRPIGTLVKNVAENDENSEGRIKGNELEYLAGSYRSLKQDKQALNELLYQQHDKLEELFQLRLLHGEVDEEEWREYLQDFRLQSCKYFATVVVILNFRDDEVQSMVNEDAICLKILQEMPRELKGLSWMTPIYNASTIFGIFSEEDEDTLLDKIRRFYQGIQECAERVSDYSVQMGVSATHTNYHHIRAAYRESIHALTFKTSRTSYVQEGEGITLGEKEAAEESCHFYLASSTVVGQHYNNRFEEDIAAAVKAVDKKVCYQVTDLFCHFLSEMGGKGEANLVYIIRYVNTILLTAMESGVELSEIYPDGVKKVYHEILEVLEPARERRYIKWRFIDPIIKYRTEYLESHSFSMLEEIEEMIAQCNGNLSLTECAEKLKVHPTYIWKALKMENGKSFSDYVEEYKLNEAKRLLLESNLTVAEIAEKMNYTNAQNFIRFFSKSTGVTPGKFRKLY